MKEGDCHCGSPPFLCGYQKYLQILRPMLKGFRMVVKENINVISPDAAAPVLSRIDDSVDHYLGSVGNHLGINGNGVAGGGSGSSAGVAAPALGAADAGAVAGGLKGAKGNQLRRFGGSLIPGGLLGIPLGVG